MFFLFSFPQNYLQQNKFKFKLKKYKNNNNKKIWKNQMLIARFCNVLLFFVSVAGRLQLNCHQGEVVCSTMVFVCFVLV